MTWITCFSFSEFYESISRLVSISFQSSLKRDSKTILEIMTSVMRSHFLAKLLNSNAHRLFKHKLLSLIYSIRCDNIFRRSKFRTINELAISSTNTFGSTSSKLNWNISLIAHQRTQSAWCVYAFDLFVPRKPKLVQRNKWPTLKSYAFALTMNTAPIIIAFLIIMTVICCFGNAIDADEFIAAEWWWWVFIDSFIRTSHNQP